MLRILSIPTIVGIYMVDMTLFCVIVVVVVVVVVVVYVVTLCRN